MIRFLKISLFILFIGAELFSCKKAEDFPPTPEIEFKSFKQYGSDSAQLVIKFKDGDGDIGLDREDTLPPFHPASIYHNNLFLIYYYKDDDGVFKPFDYTGDTPKFDTLEYKYRVPDITPTGQNKLLDGEIKVSLTTFKAVHAMIRYEIYLYDRARNKSNVLTTPDLNIQL